MKHPIIVNGDDFGISDGVCRAILTLLHEGLLKDFTSMMVVEGATERLRAFELHNYPKNAGLHLQLSNGVPLSKNAEAPSLVATDESFVPREMLRMTAPKDARREWHLQLEAFTQIAGFRPTHLDSHHGIHHLPNLYNEFIDFAKSENLPIRGGSLFSNALKTGWIKGTFPVVYDWTTKGLGGEELLQMATSASLEANLPVEIVTHPGFPDEQLRRVSSLIEERMLDSKGLQEFGALIQLAGSGSELLLSSYFEQWQENVDNGLT